MVDLNLPVLGTYAIKDVIGETPTLDQALKKSLDEHLLNLTGELDKKSKEELEKTLLSQMKAKDEIARFSGAMAHDQKKISLFHEYIDRYVEQIKDRLKMA